MGHSCNKGREAREQESQPDPVHPGPVPAFFLLSRAADAGVTCWFEHDDKSELALFCGNRHARTKALRRVLEIRSRSSRRSPRSTRQPPRATVLTAGSCLK